MLYREIIAVCSEIHTKHVNALWAEHNFWMLKLAVHKVKLRLLKANYNRLPTDMFAETRGGGHKYV